MPELLPEALEPRQTDQPWLTASQRDDDDAPRMAYFFLGVAYGILGTVLLVFVVLGGLLRLW